MVPLRSGECSNWASYRFTASISITAITAPSSRLSVRLVRPDPQRLPAPVAVLEFPLVSRDLVDRLADRWPSRSSQSKLGLICPIGRPTSPGMRLNSCSAVGVKRRIARSLPTMTIGMSTLPSRLTRSLLTRVSSSLRECSSSLTRVQLLVGALQLFLGGVELLVRALQLFVARQDLFVGRLQLLVGGFELLDDRLQVLAAGRQLAAQIADARVGLVARRAAPARFSGRASGRTLAGGAASSNSTRKCSPRAGRERRRPRG